MAHLHRPETLAEACALLAELDDPMVYGGGTAIQILLKQGILFADNFVDLALIPGLREIGRNGSELRAGPMVSVRRMETDRQVREFAPLAASAYRNVANPRVRNTASVGGNIAHGDYRLDPPTALLVLDATVDVASVRGTRSIPVREFFVDFQLTALELDELITAIRIPAVPPRAAGRFVKNSSLSANDWPCASAAVLVVDSGAKREVRIGLGAVAPVPRYVSFDATGLNDQEVVDAAIEAIAPAVEPIPDVRGGVEYKERLARVTVEDAVRGAWKDLDA
ncbi:FAD binding domain-containing protein [Saccharopolyspora sp. K220]|uniref:FAD binding domain-containing protein n=1 Tax=Saccharopolyspora soli TaxID=2926618 RepID=UPI001F5A841A|nr:FAD binding domain-containing protein [Saccharopolyspora soli]MCI2415887.1 FAD binding domain-containing protein [Saccharopolyspora soli]